MSATVLMVSRGGGPRVKPCFEYHRCEVLRGPLQQALESVPSLCTYKDTEVPLDERSDGGRYVDINAPFADAFVVGLLQLGGILLRVSDSKLRFTCRELQPDCIL